MPIARAPSHWPRSIDWMRPEHLGEERSRLDREGDGAGHERRHLDADQDGQREEEPEELDQRRRRAKHLDDEAAGQDRRRRGDRRSSAKPRPSATPQTSAVPVIRSVFTRPSTNNGALARTGEKSH